MIDRSSPGRRAGLEPGCGWREELQRRRMAPARSSGGTEGRTHDGAETPGCGGSRGGSEKPTEATPGSRAPGEPPAAHGLGIPRARDGGPVSAWAPRSAGVYGGPAPRHMAEFSHVHSMARKVILTLGANLSRRKMNNVSFAMARYPQAKVRYGFIPRQGTCKKQ